MIIKIIDSIKTIVGRILSLSTAWLPHRFMRRLSPRRRKQVNLGFIAVILILGPVAIWQMFFVTSRSDAAWWNENFLYRQVANIANSNSTQLNNFQVALTVDTSALITAGKMQSNCNDIRITDQNGNVLPYWIEEGSADCNTSTTKIWTKVPEIATSGASLFFYYGNQQAQSEESGDQTFEFFDDFNTGQLDQSRWAATGATSLSGGSLNITTGSVYSRNPVSQQPGQKVESKLRWTNSTGSYSGFSISNGNFVNGGNSASQKVGLYIRNNGSTSVRAYAGDGTSASYNIISDQQQFSSSNAVDYIMTQAVSFSNVIYYNNRSVTYSYTGTWTAPYYLILGYFTGSNAGTTDIQDVSVDWTLSRKYAATEPTVTMGSEESSPAPIHYYTFDEGTGNVASDSGALLRPGGLYNGPSWQMPSMCIAAGCIQLDGTNDFVQVNDPQLPTGDFTYSAWVNLQDVTDEMLFMASNNSGQNEMFVYVTSNKIQIFTNNVSRLITTTEITPNKWTYITVIRSGSIITVYFDGVADTSTGSDGTALNFDSCPLLIGTDADSGCNGGLSNYAQGRIDEVKIYPFALISDQVKANYISQGGLDGSGAVLGAYDNENLSDGLIGYWKYDSASYNGTSGEVLDSSGNGYNGTSACSGASCAIESATSSAKFGNALAPRNNGTQTSYATVADGGSSDLLRLSGATNMTLSSWVYLTSLSAPSAGQSFIISKYTFSGSPAGYSLMVKSDGSIRFDINGNQNSKTTDTSVVSAGEWTHIAGVLKDGNTMQVFVNGVLVSTFPISQTSITAYTGSLAFGTPSNSGGSTQYTSNGSIDEARIYNRALDPLEIKQLYQFAPGPVGYYNFEEGQGSSVNDTSTYGHNGTWSGTGTKWDAGKYGKAANFNALDNFVTAGTYSDVNFSGSYSIGTWVNFRSYGDTRSNCGVKGGVIFSKQDSYYGLVMGINDSGTYGNRITFTYSKADLSATTYTYTPTISLNRWYYVTATHDKNTNTLSMYLDGSLAHSTTLSGDYLNPSGQVYLGGHNNNCSYQYPDGRVDEMKIYNYARTPAQIIQDMNAGPPAGGASNGRDSVGYFSFDEGYGSLVHDSSPQNVTGTITNATWNENGKYGKALSFTGNGSVSLGNVTAYKTDSKTISFWAKPSSLPSGTTPIFSGAVGNWYVGFAASGMMMTSHSVAAGTQQVTYSNANTVTANDWHFYTYTFSVNGSNVDISFYQDGALAKTTSYTTGYSSSYGSAWYLGSFNGASFYYSGLLDEVRMYDYAMTQDEIEADYNQSSALVLGSFGMDADGVASNSASAIYCVPGDTSQDCAPVAEWLFEEGRGGTANDTSTNNNNGTWNGTGSKWGIGKIGKGGVFNGASDFVNISDSSTLDVGDVYTIEMWVKRVGGFGTTQYLMQKGAGPYALNFDTSNKLVLSKPGTANIFVSTPSYTDNNWHHISVTKNGSTVAMYVDGKSVAGTFTNQTSTDNNSALAIGANSGGSASFFNGSIDQVRLYNYAQTPSQVAWSYNNGKPVAYYDFDECQGPTVHSSSVPYDPALNGTIQIGPSGTQTTVGTCQDSNSAAAWWNGRVGKYNYSLNFDGTDDFVNIPNSSVLTPSSQLTISAWVNGSNYSSRRMIISKDKDWSSTSGYHLWVENTGYLSFEVGNNASNGPILASNTKLSTDTWYHIMGTYDSGSLKLYINGVLDSSRLDAPTSITYLTNPLRIGMLSSSNLYPFAGKIDDVQVFNYPLTEVQVRNVYNQGSAVRFGPLTGSP